MKMEKYNDRLVLGSPFMMFEWIRAHKNWLLGLAEPPCFHIHPLRLGSRSGLYAGSQQIFD